MDVASQQLTFLPITADDQPRLLDLMQRIYPPVYAHFWPDGGHWYVQSQYNQENFQRELQEAGADYRFVTVGDTAVGIVRTIADRSPPELPGRRAGKLHRLYLDPAVHGQGIGGQVVQFALAQSRQRKEGLLWLEAMDSAPAALAFYERMAFEQLSHFTLDMPKMYPARRGMWRLAKEL